jgi:hypothetical protein
MAASEADFNSNSEAATTPGDGHADNPTPDGTEATSITAKKVSFSADDQTKKRTGSLAESTDKANKVTKRRAPRACASCRARKVRCDVVEQFPCGNCKWDNVQCHVQESRRRK